MKGIDPKNLDISARYQILIGSIVPRPIALISTISTKGVENLAPYSSYNLVSSDPLSCVVSFFQKSEGKEKDTLRNILDTREFVINSVSVPMLDLVVKCGSEYPSEKSEVEELSVKMLNSTLVKPRRVNESKIHFECKLLEKVRVNRTTLVVGEVVYVHIDESIIENDRIKTPLLDPLYRLGGIEYGALGEKFERKIPKI